MITHQHLVPISSCTSYNPSEQIKHGDNVHQMYTVELTMVPVQKPNHQLMSRNLPTRQISSIYFQILRKLTNVRTK